MSRKSGRSRASSSAQSPVVIMPTDLTRLPDPVAAARRLPAGSIVILRDHGHPDRRSWAMRLRAVTEERGLYLLVANDPALARAAHADGIHLAERDIGRIRPWGLTSAAAHSLSAVRRAEVWGAHLVLISPVFTTVSHPGGAPLGLQRARAIAAASQLPSIAMGGLDAARSRQLGPVFAGFAAIGAFA